MKQHIRTLLSVILLSIFLSAISFAAETRGLTIVAKDTASGRQGEVRFYNKTYAVIIGIDRYQNLPAGRQLHNAVRDAKGIENVLRKNYQFDKIIILQNEQATKDRIMEVLTEELPAQMGRNDALFLFWARSATSSPTTAPPTRSAKISLWPRSATPSPRKFPPSMSSTSWMPATAAF